MTPWGFLLKMHIPLWGEPRNLYFPCYPLGLYRFSEYFQLQVTNSNSDRPAVGKLIVSQTGGGAPHSCMTPLFT